MIHPQILKGFAIIFEIKFVRRGVYNDMLFPYQDCKEELWRP